MLNKHNNLKTLTFLSFCLLTWFFTLGGCDSPDHPKTRAGELTMTEWGDLNPCVIVNKDFQSNGESVIAESSLLKKLKAVGSDEKACHVFNGFNDYVPYASNEGALTARDNHYYKDFRLILFQTIDMPGTGTDYNSFDTGAYVSELGQSVDVSLPSPSSEYEGASSSILVVSGLKIFFTADCHSNNCVPKKPFYDNWEKAVLNDSPLGSITTPNDGMDFTNAVCGGYHLPNKDGITCQNISQNTNGIPDIGSRLCESMTEASPVGGIGQSRFQTNNDVCFSSTLGYAYDGQSPLFPVDTKQSAFIFPFMTYPDNGVYEKSHRAFVNLQDSVKINFNNIKQLRLYHLHFLNATQSYLTINSGVGDVVIKDVVFSNFGSGDTEKTDYFIRVNLENADNVLKLGGIFPENYIYKGEIKNETRTYYRAGTFSDFAYLGTCIEKDSEGNDVESACVKIAPTEFVDTVSEITGVPKYINYIMGKEDGKTGIEQYPDGVQLGNPTTKGLYFKAVSAEFDPLKYFNGVIKESSKYYNPGVLHFLNPHDIKQIWCIGEGCGESEENLENRIKYCLKPADENKYTFVNPIKESAGWKHTDEKTYTSYKLDEVKDGDIFECSYRYNKHGRSVKPLCNCTYGDHVFEKDPENTDINKKYLFGACTCNFDFKANFDCKEKVDDAEPVVNAVYFDSINDQWKGYIRFKESLLATATTSDGVSLNLCQKIIPTEGTENVKYGDIIFKIDQNKKQFNEIDILCNEGSVENDQVKPKINEIIQKSGETEPDPLKVKPWLKIANNGNFKLIRQESDLVSSEITNGLNLAGNTCAYPVGYFINLNTDAYYHHKVHRQFNVLVECIVNSYDPLIEKEGMDLVLNDKHIDGWSNWEMRTTGDASKVIKQTLSDLNKNGKYYQVYRFDDLGASDCYGVLGDYTLTSVKNPVYSKLKLSENKIYNESCSIKGKEEFVALSNFGSLCECKDNEFSARIIFENKLYCMPSCSEGYDGLTCKIGTADPTEPSDTVCSGIGPFNENVCTCPSGFDSITDPKGGTSKFKCVKCETGTVPDENNWGYCIKIEDTDLKSKIKNCESTGLHRWNVDTNTCELISKSPTSIACPTESPFSVTSKYKNCICSDGTKPVINTDTNMGDCGRVDKDTSPKEGEGGGCSLVTSGEEGLASILLMALFGIALRRKLNA